LSRRLLVVAGLIATLLIGAGVYTTLWLIEQPTPPTTTAQPIVPPVTGAADSTVAEDPEAVEAAPGMLSIRLYVLDASGTSFATENHEIPADATLQEQSREVIQLLMEQSAAFPADIELRDVFITSQGVAFVDFSQELVQNHPGGSSAEELTVFGLSNTLLANFPPIKLVRILVEGREIQSLAGHLDLTVPYGRAPAYLNPESERSELPNETN